MNKLITRTINTHTINAATVKMLDGKLTTTPVLPLTIVDETVNETNALKFVQKAYGKKEQYVILSIVTTSKTWALDAEVFMKYAKALEK